MNVGIIGAGNMGSAFARRLSAAGHDVFIASKEIEDARQVAASIGPKVRAVPQQQLAGSVDVVIAATPFPNQVDALRASGSLEGKTVVEISNPIKPDMSGLVVGLTTSAAEEVAKAAPGARVVKAFNTVFAQVLGDRPTTASSAKVQVFYAGDDDAAKSTVRSLVESMGFEPLDAGPLSNARYLEPVGMLNIYLGYTAKMGTDIAPAVRKVAPQQGESQTSQAARQPTRADRVTGRDQETRP
ncbi:MAG: NADPH-dependent F420 reductase [Gemmatimonadota bacterium]|nr:NADPH-dependent F420 reductase [Gemmatimonadota bacterium]